MRLIDADALKEKLRELWVEKLQMPMEDDLFLTFVMCDIDNTPTIDAEPVKHGKWKYYNYSDINNPYVGFYECTVCKQHEHIKHKFCPNCGAKMDKE